MRNSTLDRRPARRMRNAPLFWNSPLDRFFRNDLFNVFDGDGFLETVPSLNITEEKNDYVVELAAPGLKREDFDINVESNVLTISCDTEPQVKETSEEGYYRREYDYSCFSRSVTLPDFADSKGIAAKYADGILHLTIPKKPEAQKLSQKIRVQ